MMLLSGGPENASFNEMFEVEGVLGAGCYGVVKKCYKRQRNRLNYYFRLNNTGYAVKCINRQDLDDDDELDLKKEISILRELKEQQEQNEADGNNYHQYILQFFDVFMEPDMYYIVMERMVGGELYERIMSKKRYSESEARETMQNLLLGVQYIHSQNIVHRDLKPENILLLSQNNDTKLKISDFGFAAKCFQPQSLITECGSEGYAAPEIVVHQVKYDDRVDMWSVGVVLFVLLSGFEAFFDVETGDSEVYDEICKCGTTQSYFEQQIAQAQIEAEANESSSASQPSTAKIWNDVSFEAKDLIGQLLQVDPDNRISALEALNHPWFDIPPKEPKRNSKRLFMSRASSLINIKKTLQQRMEDPLTDDSTAETEATSAETTSTTNSGTSWLPIQIRLSTRGARTT